jgi:hypothetical protein
MIRRFITTIPLDFYAAPDDTGALHAFCQRVDALALNSFQPLYTDWTV